MFSYSDNGWAEVDKIIDIIKSYKHDKEFKSCYAYKFLNEMCNASELSYLRFYLIESADTVIVEPLELTDKRDDKGLFVPVDNEFKLSFFFAAAVDE